ncbi:MAG: hypothetical protein IIB53_07820 [Planctomycetes bacterium]|nr:hypothetical protein [Planctomycetota bacterium]
MGNPNDHVRDDILRTLYDFHRKSRSPKSAARGIRELQGKLRELGHKAQIVSHNLDYLIQKGWVVEVTIDRTFRTTAGTVQNSEQTKYKISDVGMDLLETASTFKRSSLPSTVNITNIQGVTVIGEGNVVNTNFTDVSRVLDELKRSFTTSDQLDDSSRLEAVADVESLQSQLQKPRPNLPVVRTLWKALEKAAVTSGAIGVYERGTEFLRSVLGA